MTGTDLTPGPIEYRPAADGNMLMQIIDRAARAPEFDIERLQKLLELKERWDQTEAVKAFTVAMAAFKASPPKIFKNKHVAYKNKAGGTTAYDHATHSEVTEKIAAALGAHGMSHRWKIEQAEEKVRVTCIVTHALGHSESVSMTAPPDDSGSKSAVQAISSTSTLLQRYTLLAVTGMSSADLPDADDKTDAPRPELPVDVWTSLNTAATEGPTALAAAFKALSDTTRAIIVLHYATEWTNLKTQSGAK